MNGSTAAVPIDGLVAGLGFAALVVTVIAVTVIVLARPWELRGGRLADQLRIADAVSSYDFWLGLRGVHRHRRRELRAELRSNLWEAGQRVGVREAVKALGPLRLLASDAVPERRDPRWGLGVAAGLIALEVVVMFQVFVATVVVDTATATGATRADVAVTLVPGMRAVYERVGDGGLSVGMTPGPLPLVVAVAAFLVVARPWRLSRWTTRTPA